MRELKLRFLYRLNDDPVIIVTTKNPSPEQSYTHSLIQEVTIQDHKHPFAVIRELKKWVKKINDDGFRTFPINRNGYNDLNSIVKKFELYAEAYQCTLEKKYDLLFEKLVTIPSLTALTCAKPILERSRSSIQIPLMYVYANFIQKTISFHSKKVEHDPNKPNNLYLLQEIRFKSKRDYTNTKSYIKSYFGRTKSIEMEETNLVKLDNIITKDVVLGKFKPITDYLDFGLTKEIYVKDK